MIFNHFKSAWRNLIQNPFSSTINIAGLAIGITCCIFIALYVWSEKNADAFNERKQNIYRVNQLSEETGRGSEVTSYPLGTSVQNEFGGVQKIVRLGQDNVSIRADNGNYFFEKSFYWTDSTFFEIFSNPMIAGDPATALNDPNSLVITQAMAKKYFGDRDPIGKLVELKVYDGNKNFTFRITGVVADPPRSSAVQFDFLAPMHTAMLVYPQFKDFWNIYWVSTYALVDHASSIPNKTQSAAFFEKYASKNLKGNVLEFQPLSRIHLYSGHIGKNLTDAVVNIYLFSIVGIFIFLLACVNFVNISTARAEMRKKEIGVRKALGAFRWQLFSQFMTEAILVAAIVMLIALVAVTTLQPLLADYIDGTSQLLSVLVLPALFIGAMIVIGVVAGLYPAVFLSGFKPLEALKAKPEKLNGIGNSARQLLVMFQFTISIALIAGTMIINKQVHYLKQADLGFATDQLISIPVDDRVLQHKIKTVKDLLAQSPGISGIAVSGESMPADMNNSWNITWPGLTPDQARDIAVISIDADYFPLINATFVEGRNLSEEHRTDDSTSFIINEAARDMIGDDALGKEVKIGDRRGTIVGIVRDIHHYSLHQKVSPIAYFPVPGNSRACSDNIFVKIPPQSLAAAVPALKQKWEGITQDRPFEYHFVDSDFEKAYEADEKFLFLFEMFSGLAIIIACLGLMGLSSFVVNRRSREIGIRKVLGASISQIVMMLTKGFSIPIALAFVVAAPLVYFVMNEWLDKFAYKITADILLIALAGVVAWLIAFSFIGIQSWRAANINPAKILKDE